jgi:starch phosphorylase
MRNIRKFTVVPALPPRLEPLRRIAFNLWWSWDADAIALFRRLDRELWSRCGQNPVHMLGLIAQEHLERRQEDDGFVAHMERVAQALDDYMAETTWYDRWHGHEKSMKVAYFSAEYGVAESLPIYSGGLGVLAGDHLKSASDLGLPLVGVGLLYRQGYFRQYLNADGWQQERFPELDFYNMPIEKVRQPDGEPLRIQVQIGERTVTARIWRAQVGRVPLYLLDTNIEANDPRDREITARLYGGDLDMRIRQELLLGIGGLRALYALGIEPTVCHMNEGHSAFMALERARMLMHEDGVSFEDAQEATATGNVFTTHTPVPAGNDRFPPSLVRRYFEGYRQELGLSWDEFLGLGRENPANHDESFCMTVLAIKMADRSNGVSKLHGVVSRDMWKAIWPDLPVYEVPIYSITNGVHTKSWISGEMAQLLDRYLGPRWTRDPHDSSVWKRIDEIPSEELWRTHERRRERLVAFARRRLREQLGRRGSSPRELRLADEVLDPEALTIGFARRFAPYKRAVLLFRDVERLIRILSNRERPVQFLFAGKAHPADDRGKEFIRQIVHLIREGPLRRRVVFIEDYDIEIARYLVQGVDVWLNTPRRPLEASGTSGMKAAANGALNMSVLDGWWCEAYTGEVGWSIGQGEEYEDLEHQDDVESNAAYDLLEKEIIPLFYERSGDALPRKWIDRVKASMRSICPYFNTNRMVGDYAERCYRPAHRRAQALLADDLARARSLTEWKRRVRDNWGAIRIERVSDESERTMHVGDELRIHADVRLGGLSPEDVAVELYAGRLGPDDQMVEGHATRMQANGAHGDGLYTFEGVLSCRASGRHGYTVRILPRHEDLSHPYEMYVVKWAASV